MVYLIYVSQNNAKIHKPSDYPTLRSPLVVIGKEWVVGEEGDLSLRITCHVGYDIRERHTACVSDLVTWGLSPTHLTVGFPYVI